MASLSSSSFFFFLFFFFFLVVTALTAGRCVDIKQARVTVQHHQSPHAEDLPIWRVSHRLQGTTKSGFERVVVADDTVGGE